MALSLENLRKNYELKTLSEHEVQASPIDQFEKWFKEAVKSEVLEPNAFTLSTADKKGKPSSRVVLLKSVSEQGFIFFTNYDSHKGDEISKNPWVAMNFCWLELQRQVRIEGIAEKISQEESDAYFYKRPTDSQIAAIISDQSKPLESRQELELRMERLRLYYTHNKIERPKEWGGYLVKPEMIEFWQGRASRLHDRLQYNLQKSGAWKTGRLYP
ncbi:MAG: pyridoxamine 5'-phosphate oxidase [Bacteroidia bacterium]|nr:pyridoxamine 5'-phosphate oxidase [Bacteroidia bacterium]